MATYPGIKTYIGAELRPNAFLTSALDEIERSASRFGRLTPGETLGINWHAQVDRRNKIWLEISKSKRSRPLPILETITMQLNDIRLSPSYIFKCRLSKIFPHQHAACTFLPFPSELHVRLLVTCSFHTLTIMAGLYSLIS